MTGCYCVCPSIIKFDGICIDDSYVVICVINDTWHTTSGSTIIIVDRCTCVEEVICNSKSVGCCISSSEAQSFRLGVDRVLINLVGDNFQLRSNGFSVRNTEVRRYWWIVGIILNRTQSRSIVYSFTEVEDIISTRGHENIDRTCRIWRNLRTSKGYRLNCTFSTRSITSNGISNN